MNKEDIFTVEDVFNMLDDKINKDSIKWESFYSERWAKAPFILTPNLPDENLTEYFNKNIIKGTKVLELGCGEGRNSIYIANHGFKVTAVDISETAIANAKSNAEEGNCDINFMCKSMFDLDEDSFDFIYDSGCFHHLAPHRRITYLELIKSRLKKGGYYSMNCFAAGENCAEEVTDWEYYERPRRGVAFTKEKLEEIFCKDFDVLEIRKYKDGVEGTMQGAGFLWTTLFRRK